MADLGSIATFASPPLKLFSVGAPSGTIGANCRFVSPVLRFSELYPQVLYDPSKLYIIERNARGAPLPTPPVLAARRRGMAALIEEHPT